jgi:hypothetical protein
MPDGKRFVGVISADHTQPATTSTPTIQVVEHWFEELKARVPIKIISLAYGCRRPVGPQ